MASEMDSATTVVVGPLTERLLREHIEMSRVEDALAKRIARRRKEGGGRGDWSLSDVRRDCRRIARRDISAILAEATREVSAA